ncbi:hypothetical protein CF326_g3493, partial [Tilletia indica]
MPLPPPRKPAAVPANNGKVTPGPGRQRGGGFMLPPPPADSDAYSTDSDSSDDVEEDEDADEHRQVQPQKQEQDKSTNSGLDPSRRTGQFPAEGSTKRTEDGERIAAEHSNSALDPSQKRKNPNSKSAVDVAAVAQRAAAAAAAAKKFQQQQQLLIQQQRRRAVQNQPSAKGPAAAAPPGPVLNSSKSKGTSNSAAGARSATGSAKRVSEEEEDDYDLGLGPGPSMSASQSLDMDIDGEELWTHSYCVVCDRLISEPSSQPDTPGAAAAAGANVAKEAGSLAMGPSQHFNGHGNKLKEKSAPTPSEVAIDPLPRRGSKTALPTSTGAPVRRNNSSSRLSSQQPPANTSAPVRRNNSSSRLSSHGVRAGASAGSGLLGHPPRRTGSTGSRLNALSNLKPTTKLHEDKASKNAAPSTSSESGTGSKGEKPLSRADSSASIASRAGSSSAAGSSPPPSVSSQGHSSTSSLRSRVKARAGGASKGNAAGAGAHTPEGNASRRSSTAAMVPSLSSSSIHGDKEKEKEKAKEVVSHRPKKFGLYCSERCRLIDQQRSAGLGQLRPYLSYPLSPLGGPYPSIAPAAIAVTTVGSDQPAAVIPVSSSTLSMSIAAASRSNKLPVLAATAVVAANANGSTPMPALVELAKSSAEGSATLNQGLSMSMSMGMGFPSAIGAYAPAPSATPLRGQPVLTSQTATPLAPMDQSSAYMSSYGYPSSIPAVTGAFQLPTRTRTDWTPGSECPDCSDCCTCPHCLLADEEAEARTTSAASGTAPSGSGASDTATSESSHAALYGFGSGNGTNGLDSLGGMSGSAAAAGKGKQRTASGRLLTPHLFPLNEGETDYFSAYPEQIRRVLLDEHKKAQALTRTTNLLPHLHRSTSPEAASMGRQRSQSDRSSDSENGLSTAMGSLEFGPPGAPVFEPGHPLMGRRANGTGTATSSSGTISRPRSVFSGSSSQPRGIGQHAAATSSASTSFSAAPTVQAASGSTSQFSDGPNSSSITAVPGDAARSSSRTRSTSVPGGRAVEAAAAAGADGPSSDARSGLRGTGVLGTSLGTALHRASSTSHARNGSDSVRTSTNSSRRSTIVSASYASPLRFLQPGLKHMGTPSVAAVDFEAMRGVSTAEQERSQEEEENEEFARLRRGDRRAEWSTGSSSVRTSPSKNSQAVSIPASSWRGHRRAGSAMSARAAFDSSLDAQFAQSMGGGRPASVAGTSGLSFGALNSLKRAQALAMVRELDRERVSASPSGAVDASLNLEGGTSVSVATSLNAVREGRQEHHRREGDELTVGLVQQQQFN